MTAARLPRVLAALFATLALSPATPAASIWVEGESYLNTNLERNLWLDGNKDLCSGGATAGFILDYGEMPWPGFVLWRIPVAEAGRYSVYVRAGSGHARGVTRHRFLLLNPATGTPKQRPAANEGWVDWPANGSPDAMPLETTDIGVPRNLEWLKLPDVDLEPGYYLLELQVIGPPDANPPLDRAVWTQVDAWCLTTDLFAPRGDRKPPGVR